MQIIRFFYIVYHIFHLTKDITKNINSCELLRINQLLTWKKKKMLCTFELKVFFETENEKLFKSTQFGAKKNYIVDIENVKNKVFFPFSFVRVTIKWQYRFKYKMQGKDPIKFMSQH